MVPMFSKTMDTLADDMADDPDIGITVGERRIPALLFMDDVLSMAEGYLQQENTLKEISEFGAKHQIEWGVDKCKVLEVGTHQEQKKEWVLGSQTIQNCQSYRYLGEIITRDGKNEENLRTRFEKVKSTVRAINTCGKNEIMKRIEINALVMLHDSVTLPTLLYDAETWPLNQSIRREIDKMELWAWKSMLGLPKTTPTAPIIYCTGAMYASIRVEQKQLLYLQKVLLKPADHWTRVTLNTLDEYNIGWARQIRQIQESWAQEMEWDAIQRKSKNQWRREVAVEAERKNRERMLADCNAGSRGEERWKSKTKSILPYLENVQYERKTHPILLQNSKLVARAYVMGRFRMLQCAANFSAGYGSKNCSLCKVCDDEEHRINNCPLYANINLYSSPNKIDFNCIYSENEQEAMKIVELILKMWDLGNGRNCMKCDPG